MDNLNWLREKIYIPNNIEVIDLLEENQNIKYGGTVFNINNGMKIRYRNGNITKKKKGYFSAFWEKDENNKNKAFELSDDTDFLVINIIDRENRGQFVFSKDLLDKKKIYRSENSQGKMSMRVYPDWVELDSQIAKKTQDWQLEYFINFKDYRKERLKELYYL